MSVLPASGEQSAHPSGTHLSRVAELLADVPPIERLRLLTAGEAARLLGISRATCYRLAAEGRIAHVKGEGSERGARGRAGAIRFRVRDVISYTVAREVAAFAEPQIPRGERRVSEDVRKAT